MSLIILVKSYLAKSFVTKMVESDMYDERVCSGITNDTGTNFPMHSGF